MVALSKSLKSCHSIFRKHEPEASFLTQTFSFVNNINYLQSIALTADCETQNDKIQEKFSNHYMIDINIARSEMSTRVKHKPHLIRNGKTEFKCKVA